MPLNIGDVEYDAAPQRRRARGLGADAAATTASTGFFSSPDDLLWAAQQTNDYVTSMADTIRRGGAWLKNVPAGNGPAIQAFFNQWANFFASDFSSRVRVLAHWAASDLQGTLKNFQEQAADWGKKLKKWGADVAGTPTPSATGGASNTFMWIGIAVVGIAGLFLIGKLVHTVTLGNAALEEAETEALRIADEKRRKRADRGAFSIT